MTFNHLYRFTWIVLLGGQLSCADSNFSGGGKSDSKEGEDDKETDQADQPQEVAGAFLTCAYIHDPAFGCTFFKDGEPVKKSDHKFKTQLFNDVGDEVEMGSTTAPEASEYHVIGNLPEAYHDSGKIKVSATPIVGDPLALEATVATKDIKEQPLGTLVDLDEPVAIGQSGATADTSKLALTKFSVRKSWTPAKANSAMGALAVESHTAVPGNFCKNGQINARLDAGAQIMTSGISSLFKMGKSGDGLGDVNYNIVDLPGGPVEIGGKTNICFKRFSDDLIGGNTELAHVGGGCIFVWARLPNVGEYLLIGEQLQGGTKIEQADLRALAKTLNDRPGACN